MSGFDLILEKVPTKLELKKVLSKAFEIKEEFIFISEDVVDFPTNGDNRLWCVIYEIEGQFLSLCKLFLKDETKKNTPIFIAKTMCYLLNVHCLVDDNSINPYSWTMLSPDGAETNTQTYLWGQIGKSSL